MLTYSGKNNKYNTLFAPLFVDIISKNEFYDFKHSTGSEETIKEKQAMKRDANTCGVKVKSFRANNSTFKSAESRLELENDGHNISFCGVRSHHHNGIAKIYIGTMVEKTRKVLLNSHTR